MDTSDTSDKHAEARDRKRAKRGQMVVTNRSIFVIQDMIGKRAQPKPKKPARNEGHRMVRGQDPHN